jgi:hypothetical protein
MLDHEERERVQRALHRWIGRIDDPDASVIHIAQHGPVSMRQLVAAVDENVDVGRDFLDVVEFAARRISLDAVLARFEGRESLGQVRP